MDIPAELAVLLKEQQGLASRRQLLSLGITRAALRWRLGRTWQWVLPGVVATFTGVLTPRQRLIAAQLLAGPESMIASSTAATWHGVESARSPRITMTAPATKATRRTAFVVVRRSSRADPGAWARPPLLISSRARAVVDAAHDAPAERVSAAIVIEAVQRRLVTVEAVRHELERGPRRGSRPVRLGLAAAEGGAWSIPERDLIAIVSRSRRLPEAWPNAELSGPDGTSLPTPDLWFDDVGLAVQVHSRAYHLRDADWDGTVAGDSALGEHGVVVLGVTPAMIGRAPAEVLARVERAHSRMRDRPRPNVLATKQFW